MPFSVKPSPQPLKALPLNGSPLSPTFHWVLWYTFPPSPEAAYIRPHPYHSLASNKNETRRCVLSFTGSAKPPSAHPTSLKKWSCSAWLSPYNQVHSLIMYISILRPPCTSWSYMPQITFARKKCRTFIPSSALTTPLQPPDQRNPFNHDSRDMLR